MNEATRRRGQFALATALSVVAYHLSVFGVFFLFPLQWVRSRLGVTPFLVASGLAFAGIVAAEAGIKAVMHSLWTAVDAMALVLPGTLVAGWAAIVLLERAGWRFLFRVLAVTALAALVLFPLAASLLARPEFMRPLADTFGSIWDKVIQTPGLDASATAGLNKGEFFELLKQVFLGTFLLVFFLFWMFTGRLAKTLDAAGKLEVLKKFSVPPQGALVLLVLWGALLTKSLLGQGGAQWDWGFWQYVLMNFALIALVVHALSGVGIVEALMARWKWPSLGRIAVRAALVLLLFAPGAGQIVVLVGLPLLAVLELWVNLRTRTQEVGQ